MDEALAQAETQTAVPSPGTESPQIDMDALGGKDSDLGVLDQLFHTGKAELPVKGGGERQGQPEAGKVAGAEPQRVSSGIQEPRTSEENELAGATGPVGEGATGATGPAATGATGPEGEGATGSTGPVGEGATGATGPTEDDTPRVQRPRLKDLTDQAIAAVKLANPDWSWAECERSVLGGDPGKREDAELPDLGQIVTTLRSEVTDIKTKLTAAGADEGLFTAEIAQLTQDLAEKQADLKMAERDLEDVQEAVREEAEAATAQWQNDARASRAAAIAAYPDVADKATPLGKAVATTIDAMQDPNHPDHNLLYAANAAEYITAKEAAKLGIAPVGKAAPAPPAPKLQVPPIQKMRPVSGAASSASDNRPEDAKKKVVDYVKSDEVSLQDLDAFQGVGDFSEKGKALVANIR